jgi:3-phenylpropionate/cinnamic acid dioxygenase small subunit
VIEQAILAALDALQMKYLGALDQRDFDAWLDCFADEAAYICISRENHEASLPVAIMMDDTRARLRDRVRFIKQVWSGTYEDYATRHFVQRIDSKALDKSYVSITTNFMVSYTNRRGGSDILVTGVYDDTVDVNGGTPKFVSKRAILDTVITPRYLVYPV